MFFAALLLALSTPALAQRADPTPPPPLPSVTLPSALDRVLRDYEAAWRRGDASALATLFAEDGFILQGGRPPVRGREAIRAAYSGQGGSPLRLRALAFATADTVGYIIGAYGYADDPADQGKFTLTLRRTHEGRWLIFSDMDNASRAGRPAGASATPLVPTPAPIVPHTDFHQHLVSPAFASWGPRGAMRLGAA